MMTQAASVLMSLTSLLAIAKASALVCEANANNCAVDVDDATCSGTTNAVAEIKNCGKIICDPNSTGEKSCYEYTISNVDFLQCLGESACQEAEISNAHSLECTNGHACQQVTISNVGNLVCTGDSACYGSTISDIPSGGTVDCVSVDEDSIDSCSFSTMTSTNPFTVTCQGDVGVSSRDCRDGSITSPEGSIFCYGGSSTYGVCDGLKINDSVGCVICGNDEACQGVELVDENGSNVANIPKGEVFVYDQCESSDVVAYLNKVHVDGNCEDGDDNGVCDVVEAYCHGDSNCLSNYKQANYGDWYAHTVLDVDPDSLPSSNDNEDKVGKESVIVGSVVIVVFLLIIIAAVGYFCKKSEWSCCGMSQGQTPHEEVVDQEKQQEDDNKDSQTALVMDNHDAVEDV